MDPEEPRSRTPVTPDVDHEQDPQPGCTTSGQRLTQETFQGLSSNGNPVTQDTGGLEAFPQRPETRIRRSTPRPHRDDYLNKPSQPTPSERYPINGNQRPQPKEISGEEDASTKNSQNDFSEKEVVHIPPNDDNAEDSFQKLEDTFCHNISTEDELAIADQSHSQTGNTGISTSVDQVPVSKNSLREGDKPPQVVNISTNEAHKRKDIFSKKMVTEDTSNDQSISTEDESAIEDQSHSQTGNTGISTSVDQVPVSKNSLREGDKPPQVVNISTNEAHKRKDIFSRKMVTEDTSNDQSISTEDESAIEDQSHSQTGNTGISTSVDQVPVSKNSLREGDKPPQVVNISTNEAHKRKDIFSRKMVTEDTSNDQSISTEDESAIEDQSHSQTGNTGISTSVDQVPVSKNSLREGDKPPQVVNIPINEVNKRKEVFPRKKDILLIISVGILVLLGLTLYIYTAFVDFHAQDVQPHKPNAGDLVAVPRWWGAYYHYGIYIGDGYLVHRTGGIFDWFWLIKAKIKVERYIDVIKSGDHVRIEDGTWEGKEPLPKEEIIRRAKSKIGEEGFHPFFKNCEHFARWCRYAETVSKEANDLLFILQGIFSEHVLFVLLVVIGLLLMSHYFKKFPPRV